jgi:hypothetical protein
LIGCNNGISAYADIVVFDTDKKLSQYESAAILGIAARVKALEYSDVVNFVVGFIVTITFTD